ncbi:MAG: hypothetical protein K8T25_01445 [Planctomycetia bacterium]|nr:hypothetical protein [Planctomycetia bacterium]
MSEEQKPWTFVEPEGRFSFRVPQGWAIDPSGQRGARIIVFAPDVDENFRANVNIVLQSLSPLTRDEYLTASRLQIRKMNNLATLPVDEPAPHFPGWHVLEWTTREAPSPIRVRQLIAFAGSEVFVVTAMATAASFDHYESVFRVLLDSFQVVGCPDPNAP